MSLSFSLSRPFSLAFSFTVSISVHLSVSAISELCLIPRCSFVDAIVAKAVLDAASSLLVQSTEVQLADLLAALQLEMSRFTEPPALRQTAKHASLE